MRADKVIMACVGALGLYAVYRMIKTDGKPNSATEMGPSASASSLASSLDSRQVLSSPTSLLLKAQTQYRMRLELQGGLPPFSETSSDGEISGALAQLGFRDVQVFRSAPAWWPQGGSETANAQGGTRFVVAQWGPTTLSVPRPKAMVLVWQAKAPS